MCLCCRGTPTYVCFDCRFVTKRLWQFNHRTALCSHCGKALVRFGKGDFPTPARRDDRRWRKLEARYEAEKKAEEQRQIGLMRKYRVLRMNARKTRRSGVAQR